MSAVSYLEASSNQSGPGCVEDVCFLCSRFHQFSNQMRRRIQSFRLAVQIRHFLGYSKPPSDAWPPTREFRESFTATSRKLDNPPAFGEEEDYYKREQADKRSRGESTDRISFVEFFMENGRWKRIASAFMITTIVGFGCTMVATVISGWNAAQTWLVLEGTLQSKEDEEATRVPFLGWVLGDKLIVLDASKSFELPAEISSREVQIKRIAGIADAAEAILNVPPEPYEIESIRVVPPKRHHALLIAVMQQYSAAIAKVSSASLKANQRNDALFKKDERGKLNIGRFVVIAVRKRRVSDLGAWEGLPRATPELLESAGGKVISSLLASI